MLSEERKWLNGWTLFYFVAALGILGLSVFVTHDARGYGFATMAVVSIVAVAGIISTRFDALLATEFRERTWGSLMLLPADPCDLLWTKLEAAISEQRFAALPLIAAQLSLALFGPHASLVVAGITAVISVLICGLLCQMSCLNHLLGKAWWISPCQMIGFAAVIVVAFMIWSNFGLWLGFLLTVAMLISVLCLLHVSFVRPIARSWVET